MARWTSAQLNGHISEHELQASCVRWFRNKYRHLAEHLFAIPNGAVLRGGDRIQRAKQWQRLEREGAMAGVADLFLAVPSGDLAGLWIEMKTPRGRQSDAQKRFESNMVRAGFGYVCPRGRDEFERVVVSYLETGKY